MMCLTAAFTAAVVSTAVLIIYFEFTQKKESDNDN